MPQIVRNVVQKINDADHVAYLVGGSVRDYLMGRPTKDHDIATSARPEKLMELFPNAYPVGKAFGVIRIIDGDHEVEVATFRQDSDYEDHRRPQSVQFKGPVEDAFRRDFTINGIYYDPKTQRILDLVGGLGDLAKRSLRAIGDPDDRFQEDALRLLRAVRFATTLHFEIDPDTLKALKKRFRLLGKVSRERVQSELSPILMGPHPDQALQLLSQTNLILEIIPEAEWLKSIKQPHLDQTESTAWNTTLHCLKLFSKSSHRTLTLAWAVLLHEIKKPQPTKNITPEKTPERDFLFYIEQICRRLKLPNEITTKVLYLSSELFKFKEVFQMRNATLQRWIQHPGFPELLELHRISTLSQDGNLSYYDFCFSKLEEFRQSAPSQRLLDGEDLIQLGFEPGPHFTQILRTVEDLVLEKRLQTKEEALEFVVKHFVT